MTALSLDRFYVIGGTLHWDAPSYVRRRADDELFAGLSQGRFCYVLTSRQMGKSSLMVRTALRLRESGWAAVVLDLTAVGQNLTAEQWYEGLISEIGQQLDLEDELEDFWHAHKNIGPLQRWLRALREVILPYCTDPVVIFIDEIDAVRSLPFSTDEFFAGIRELYNRRTADVELQRLTFCLLGVATPSDLIRDTRTTPFNIGRGIELRDFTETEALPLAQGLGRDEKSGRALLKRILHWTGGHPYLTQSLCQAVAKDASVKVQGDVDRLCEELFLSSRARGRDDNLIFVRKRLLDNEVDRAGLLERYEQVLRGKRVSDDETDQFISVLHLAGVVWVREGCLVVRNRIYAHVFDRKWVTANLPDAELERQRRAYRRGLMRATAIAALIILLPTVLLWVTSRSLKREQASLYAAQINLAQQAWESGNIEQARELLKKTDREDLRSFEWLHLWRLCNSDLHTFEMADDSWSVAVSPDGDTLAAGDDSGVVRLWSLADQRVRATLRGHTGRVNALAFFPDGQTLVTGGNDKTVKLWAVATGQPLGQLDGHEEVVHSVAISPRQPWLVTGSEDGMVRVWELGSRRPLATFVATLSPTLSMALAPDGTTLALGSGLGVIEIWDVAKSRKLTTLKARDSVSQIRATAFSPDGQWLAVGSEDGMLNLWAVNHGGAPITFEEGAQSIASLAFSPDGQWLAAGQQDKTVTLWQVAERRKAAIVRGHQRAVRAVAFAPSGKLLVSASEDGSVKVWDLNRPPAQTDFDGEVGAIQALAFSPNSQFVAVGGAEVVKLWDIASQRQARVFSGHNGLITSLAFAPDGQNLATAAEDETVRLWDANTGRQLRTFIKGGGEMRALAFSPDGRLLTAGGQDKLIHRWLAATGEELARLPEQGETIRTLAFSPDGRVLATSGGDGVIKLWSVAAQNELAALKGYERPAPINSVAFSPQGHLLAAASDNGLAKLWGVGNRQVQLTLKGHAEAVWGVAFSRDGKRLATVSKDKTLKLWDTGREQELMTLRSFAGEVRCLAFSPDGKVLATGGADGQVKLWRTF